VAQTGRSAIDYAHFLRLKPDPEQRKEVIDLLLAAREKRRADAAAEAVRASIPEDEKTVARRRAKAASDAFKATKSGLSAPSVGSSVTDSSGAPLTPRRAAVLEARKKRAEDLAAFNAIVDSDDEAEAEAAKEAEAVKLARGAELYDLAALGSKPAVERMRAMLEDLERPVSVDAQPLTAKRSPLHSAAFHGNRTAAKLLVEAGAQLEKRDYIGRTPLMAAVRHLAF